MSHLSFLSSRGGSSPVTMSGAILQGLAPDGGLYVPSELPGVDVAGCADLKGLPAVARVSLEGFFAGDALQPVLGEIADAALAIDAPTTAVTAAADRLFALELFHGPTAAFKDFGARFLAECMQRLDSGASQPVTILVATSGDTGGAVAAAFHRRPWVRVVILYPRGLVSPRQEHQLTCWGDNVLSLRIDGTFDDCQRLVKEAFVDPELRARHRFSSANSINVGRLLPQMVYYAASSLEVVRVTGEKPSFIIPAGNLGNAFAAMWARAVGFPIGRLVLAHNANRTVPDYLTSGTWRPRPSIPTLASAMDVGNPSNMERVRTLFPSADAVRAQLTAHSVDDAAIRTRIRKDFLQYGRVWCPHTATAAEVYARLDSEERGRQPWVLVATAHPAKFNEVVEPIIGEAVAIPGALSRLLELPQHCLDVPATLRSVADALE